MDKCFVVPRWFMRYQCKVTGLIGARWAPQVVVKDEWPPKSAKNVETIAASFVPPRNGSAVRLFNLAVRHRLLACVSTACVTKTLPLACVSTAFVG